MADIRLRTVTVDSGPLYIRSGAVTVLDTTVSISSVSASFVANGGVSINCSQNGVSSTSGGALTVGGGIAATRDAFFGQNVKMDNSIGVLEVGGLSTPRFLVDSVVNKECKISPDGVNTRFTLSDSTLRLTSTGLSTNSSTAALVVVGGVSIMSTAESNSVSGGNALTIAGAVGISKSINIGTKAVVGETNSQVVIGDVLTPTDTGGVFLDYFTELDAGVLSSQTDKNVLISPFSGKVGIATTSPNFTLDVNGSISGTEVTTGALWVSGNVVANNISAPTANFTSATIPSLFTTSMTIGNVTVSNITSNNLSMNDASITNLSSSNIQATNITVTNIRNTNMTSTNLIVTNSRNTSMTVTNLRVTNITSAGLNVSSGTLVSCTITNSTITNSIVTANTTGDCIITNLNNTTATIANLVNTTALTSASGLFTGSLSVNGPLSASNNSNTIGSIITTGGNVGVGTSVPGYRLHVSGESYFNGSMILEGGTSSYRSDTVDSDNLIRTYIAFGQNGSNSDWAYLRQLAPSNDAYLMALDIHDNGNEPGFCIRAVNSVLNPDTVNEYFRVGPTGITSTNLQLSGGITVGNLNISSGMTSPSANLTAITTGGIVITGGNLRATWNANTIGNIVTTGGNVGIGIVSPSYTLDVNGTIRATGHPNVIGSIVTSSGSLSVGTGNVPNPAFRIGMAAGSAIGTTGPDRMYINFTGFDLDITSDPIYGGTGSVMYFGRANRTVTVGGTVDSTAVGNGTILINGGASVAKRLNVGGNVQIYSTADSADVSTGALVVSGGVGIGKNLNVLGNTIIAGNLTVQGTSTTIDTTNTTLKDNIIVLNAGPAGSRDSGVVVTRYQQDNNVGDGDVVNDTTPLVLRLGDQTGMTSNQVKLPAEASSSNDYYTNWWIRITSGFSNDQVRQITGYNGSTKIASLSSAWSSQNPANNDYVSLYNKPYVGLFYNETNDVFVFGSTVGEPGQTNVNFTDRMPIEFFKATSVSTEASTNLSSGGLVLSGGISINSTVDSTSLTSGGTITTAGGISVAKTIRSKDIIINGIQFTPNSGDIWTTQTFTATNNQSSFADITGLSFAGGVWGADIYLTAKIIAISNLSVNFHIRAVNRGTNWEIVKTYVGDDSGIQFNMTNSGQLQYTTPNFTGATSIQFKYRAITN